jgi:hypothetical protein
MAQVIQSQVFNPCPLTRSRKALLYGFDRLVDFSIEGSMGK